MTRAILLEVQYKKALAAIKKEIAGGLARAEEELACQKLVTHWQIGCIIDRDILIGRSRPERGSMLYKRLSADLGISQRVLQETVLVFRAFPEKPKKEGLSWSHYIMLTRVSDPRTRLTLKKRILKEDLKQRDMRRIIKDLKRPKDFIVNKGRLAVQRGKLYHYCTMEGKDIDSGEPTTEIDCGFDISTGKPKGVTAVFERGRLVRSTKTKDGYTLTRYATRPSADILYTYRGIVKRVVDADTLLVKIDVGFGIFIRQRLRLRGIDAPEINTDAGLEAKAYVQDVLKRCPCLVIKTYGSDKYDRYLVDVFILPGSRDPHEVAAKGKLLNQILLDEGLAEVWGG